MMRASPKLIRLGAKLVYSTLFGGNGNEATLAAGGIAFDSLGNIFVGMDTKSTNLTVAPAATPGPFQSVYGGGSSDGFLAVFQPVVTAPVVHLKYCTYLGINAQATVTGVAVDSVGNAYLAGYTSDPLGTLATTNGFQTVYGGGTYNGFVMKILPSGMGPQDLSYGTFLGGSVLDQALAIAVGQPALPGTVYVTGTTQSPNFPVNGAIAPLLNGSANAFVAVIAQLSSGTTTLIYSSYLGGSQSDAGLGIFFAASNQIYVTGSTKSWDFPWQFNFQTFSGDQDAFVAEIDPGSAGAASLLYATPLGGTAPAGVTATAQGNGIGRDAGVDDRSSVAGFWIADRWSHQCDAESIVHERRDGRTGHFKFCNCRFEFDQLRIRGARRERLRVAVAKTHGAVGRFHADRGGTSYGGAERDR